jgi:hypothetical protein
MPFIRTEVTATLDMVANKPGTIAITQHNGHTTKLIIEDVDGTVLELSDENDVIEHTTDWVVTTNGNPTGVMKLDVTGGTGELVVTYNAVKSC